MHNVLEHDASLSRSDAAFGNNHVFNQTVFDTSKAWWTDEIITAKQLANSKIYRQLVSRATNDNYTFGASVEEFSLGEVAAPVVAFGDTRAGTVPRDLVLYFFRKSLFDFEDVGFLVAKMIQLLTYEQKTSVCQRLWAGVRRTSQPLCRLS